MGKAVQRSEDGAGEKRAPKPARLAAGAGLAIGATFAASGTAQAADFTVTNTDGDGPGSLRDAIEQANANDNSATEVDRVLFQSGLSGTIHLNQPPGPDYGQLYVDEALNIVGPGADQISVSADAGSPVFYIRPGTYGEPVTISGLRIIQGSAKYNQGGNILSRRAALTVSNSVVKSGQATAGGGIWAVGAYNDASLTIENTTISGNVATEVGGGIGSYADQITIRNSTIADNAAGAKYDFDQPPQETEVSGQAEDRATEPSPRPYGGGGAILEGPTTVENSTFTGNATPGQGGAINFKYQSADSGSLRLVVRSATISGNAAGSGGGIYAETPYAPEGETPASPASIENSIVAGNDADNAINGHELAGGPFETAFTLIQRPENSVFTETVPGSNILGLDPLLGALSNNGGPTWTMPLTDPSPALDKGRTPTGQTTDQRGLSRPSDLPGHENSSAAGADGADMGAFERQAPAPAGECNGEPATIGLAPAGEITFGTAGRDVIVGDGAANEIRGRGGNDLICGRGAADVLRGGPGNDVVLGEAGNDNVFGDQDNDTLRGGAGNDKVSGATGNDRMIGQNGQDRLAGAAGNDRGEGGANNDVLIGASGVDNLLGGPGNDRLNGGQGVDRLNGGPGRDQEIQQ